MLSLPDLKEKQLLFITVEYGTTNHLHLHNNQIRFIKNNTPVDTISCHKVFAVCIVGEITLSTSLIKTLLSYGISIVCMNYNLNAHLVIAPQAEGNYLLRARQYQETDAIHIARQLIHQKILSQKKLLNEQNIHDHDEQLENISKKVLLAQTNYELLGLEGNASKIYFQAIFSEMGWVRRCPQAKEDIINLLLDIGYSFIFHFCDSLLRLFGFDTYKGYYHQLFFERKSLSCDIIEPMRTIIDRQLIKSWHLGQIKQKDFIFKNGEFMFKDGFSGSRMYSRIFFDAILKQKESIYLFIQGFYRFILDPMKYPFPVFTPA